MFWVRSYRVLVEGLIFGIEAEGYFEFIIIDYLVNVDFINLVLVFSLLIIKVGKFRVVSVYFLDLGRGDVFCTFLGYICR